MVGAVAPDGTVALTYTTQLGSPAGLYQYTLIAGSVARILSFEVTPP